MSRIRTTLVVLGSTAAVAASGAPALAQQGAGTSPSDSAQQAQAERPQGQRRGGKARGGRLSDAQLTRVATALGTDLATLKAAQAEVKAAVAATEARETRAQVEALLAQELGVGAEQVRSAFASVRPAGGRRGGGDCLNRPASGDQPATYPGDTAGTYPSGV